MLTKREILDYLREQKSEFFVEFQLSKIGLFGSFARNEASDNSDIDILIEFLPNTPNLSEKKEKLKSRIKKQFNREVDLCREKYIKPYFKRQLLKSVVYV